MNKVAEDNIGSHACQHHQEKFSEFSCTSTTAEEVHTQTQIWLTLYRRNKHPAKKTSYNKRLPRLIHLSTSKFLYPYLTHKSTNASLAFHKELLHSPLWAFFSKLPGSRLKTRPCAPPSPREESCLGPLVSQQKAPLVLSLLLISSPNAPAPPELPLPKSVSKSDYSCVSSGWEIWPMAYWHLTSDLSSVPLSCKWSSAAGSNCMSSIRFIESYAKYIEVFPSCNLYRRHR